MKNNKIQKIADTEDTADKENVKKNMKDFNEEDFWNKIENIITFIAKKLKLSKKGNCYQDGETYNIISWWWRIERFFKDVYIEITNFPSNFFRSLKWFKRTYHNYDFDYNYLYYMIEEKLADMEKSMSKYASHTCSKRIALIMRYALHHLSFITDDYKCVENLYKLHSKKYGESKMVMKELKDETGCSEWKGLKYEKCKTIKEQKYADKIHTRIGNIWEERKVYHKRKFFYTFEKYIEYWWD